MVVHNSQSSSRFQQQSNDFFNGLTIADAKKYFDQGLSDTQAIEPCRSMQNKEMAIPEAYDWRQQNPECAREAAPEIDKSCSSSYVHASLSAVEDRICAASKGQNKVRLSSKELIECDKTSNGCKGGTVNRVLAWGKRKGFIPEECYSASEDAEQAECTVESLQENECRINQNVYKVIDYCLSQEVEGIKREIMTNGPVLGQINPYTDFLPYASGHYQRTQEAFRY